MGRALAVELGALGNPQESLRKVSELRLTQMGLLLVFVLALLSTSPGLPGRLIVAFLAGGTDIN